MDFEKIMYAPYLALGNHSVDSKFDHWLDRISTNGTNEQPTTKSPSDNGGNTNLNESYKMAAQVAVGAAIIVALTILVALIWNSLKRRLPDHNNSGTSPTSRRYSSDSFDRLVEDRLRNRPPPYSQDHDKPPSYEESFQDSSSRPRLAASRGRERRRMQREMHREQTATVHETNRYPTQPVSQESPVSLPQPMPEPLVSPGVVVRTVSYDNRAFSVDDDQPTFDIPSISMVVYENEVSQACQNADTEEAVVMFHL